MATEVFANDAAAVVTSGGTTAPSAGTSESWTVSTSTLPAASSSATPPTQFYVTDPAAKSEKILITNISGSTATAIRGADGTTPVTHASGFTIQQVITRASVRALQSPDWVNVVAQGADPTGTTACDTIVNALITGLPAGGGTIYFPTGTYKVSSNLLASLATTQTVKIRGDGTMATVLNYYGTGDCIRMYQGSSFGSSGGESFFSGIYDLTIDGTNSTGTSGVGIHAGDITFFQLQGVLVQNFTGSSGIGIRFDNTTTWTEEADVRAAVANCTRGVVLDMTTGFNSYGYSSFDLTFFQSGAQSCFCVVNGALLYHSTVKIRGDINGSATTLSGNPGIFYLSGVGPSGSQNVGSFPTITASNLDVLIEPNNQSGSATHFMQTFYLDSATFGNVYECYGLLDFAQGTGSFAPVAVGALTGSAGFFGFSGIIVGDSVLNPTGTQGWQTWGTGSVLTYLPGVTIFDGFFPTITADVFSTTLDGTNASVFFNYSGVGAGTTLAAPQRKLFFVHQPASGGPYTLTWPSSGTPTTTNPNVIWAEGTAPVLQTAASAVDVVEAVTYDGATWYARHVYPSAPVYPGTGGLAQVKTPAGLAGSIQQSQLGATSAVTSNTTTTIASLGSVTVPANDPVAGARYRVTAFGTLGTTTSAPTFILGLRWGGTGGTLITSVQSATTANAPALTVSLSAAPWHAEGEITFLTTTTCVGWLRFTLRNSATVTTLPSVYFASAVSAVTVTTSASEAMALCWTWGTSNSANTITATSTAFERVA